MKKVTFVSNFINHHQLPMAEVFIHMNDIDYSFVATDKIPQERIDLGYRDENDLHPFVLKAYSSDSIRKDTYALVDESDIVVIGSAPDDYMDSRLRQGKITFHSSERYFKKGLSLSTFPRYFLSSMRHIKKYEKKKLFYLCMSAYTANDVNVFCNFMGRTFKWGYFPEYIDYNVVELMEKKKHKLSLIWAGRLIEWKHPEQTLYLATELKKQDIDFELSIIGIGPMKTKLESLCEANSLSDCVKFLGAMPPEKVREHMTEANIFLFTSDYNEGWGVVLNEAMNSGCAVVASHAIGAVPFLIKHGVNGLVYRCNSIEDLLKNVLFLIQHPDAMAQMGVNAYYTIKETWNASVAGERLIVLNDALKKGEQTPYVDGPCSVAPPISNKEMYERIMRGEPI